MLMMNKVIYLGCLVIQRKAEKHQKNFLKNVEMLLKVRKDALNSYKSNLFPIISNTTSRETSVNE